MSNVNQKNTTLGIIQARMGSTRFPKKMMATFHGYPLMEWVLRRVLRAYELTQVILAIPNTPENEVLAEMGEHCGVRVFRGSEQDVLLRFVEAARSAGQPDIVVRICADNPLIAPEEIDRLVRFFKESNFDYAYNHIPTADYQGPDGLGAECVRADILNTVANEVNEQKYREHVTLFIREHPERFSIGAPPVPLLLQGLTQVKLDIDTSDDLAKLEHLPTALNFETPLNEIIAYVR